jgi:hypothetical protein
VIGRLRELSGVTVVVFFHRRRRRRATRARRRRNRISLRNGRLRAVSRLTGRGARRLAIEADKPRPPERVFPFHLTAAAAAADDMTTRNWEDDDGNEISMGKCDSTSFEALYKLSFPARTTDVLTIGVQDGSSGGNSCKLRCTTWHFARFSIHQLILTLQRF